MQEVRESRPDELGVNEMSDTQVGKIEQLTTKAAPLDGRVMEKLGEAHRKAMRLADEKSLRWHKVEDELPQDGERVLMVVWGSEVEVGYWQKHDNAWWWAGNGVVVHPTHWMPLPDPPRKDK